MEKEQAVFSTLVLPFPHWFSCLLERGHWQTMLSICWPAVIWTNALGFSWCPMMGFSPWGLLWLIRYQSRHDEVSHLLADTTTLSIPTSSGIACICLLDHLVLGMHSWERPFRWLQHSHCSWPLLLWVASKKGNILTDFCQPTNSLPRSTFWPARSLHLSI
jgi:hypothetical protein